MFSHLKNENLRTGLTFLVDIIEYLHNMNEILQRKDSFIHEPYTTVKAFQTKWLLFQNKSSPCRFALWGQGKGHDVTLDHSGFLQIVRARVMLMG
jgi:hypothetical protein